jgi:hypothetical protein
MARAPGGLAPGALGGGSRIASKVASSTLGKLDIRAGFSRAASRGAVAALALVLAGRAAAACPRPLSTQLVPLPVYATNPNEGATYGLLPVILRVCPEDQRTEAIFAPSLTWNSVIHTTGSFRWYHYASPDTTVTTILSVSTRTNYELLLRRVRLPTAVGDSTDELSFRARRSVFERYFGLGPDTPSSGESSYTSRRFVVSARHGLNLAPYLNVGASLALERDDVEAIGVPHVPLTLAAYPDAPGLRGATLASQGLDLRYDHRVGGDYAERGVRIDLGGSVVEGLDGSPTFLRGNLQIRGIFSELPRLSGSARLWLGAVTSGRAPFYQQTSLGGSTLLRGFTEGRFVDRQAWTVELEQRVRVLTTALFGVVTDWRIDPFVTAGQVFGRFPDALSRPRTSAGVGFRAFVHPNVLGRIDVAVANEGLKIYVEIGYPY